MKIKVKLHSYLITDNGTASIVPAAEKLSKDALKEAKKAHESVFYVGLRDYDAEVVEAAGPGVSEKEGK